MTAGLVLGLDTSTVVCVGLAQQGDVLATAVVQDRMVHVEQLIPLVHKVMAESGRTVGDLTGIVVGLGPGPFTGLRVGVVSAQVLAMITGAALHGICSLDVIAAQHAMAHPGQQFCVATDARRREVYWARYDGDGSRLGPPQVGPPAELPRLPVVGPACALYPDQLLITEGPRSLDPGVLAGLGSGLPDAGRTPLYLRRPDATEPTRRKSVLPRRMMRS